MIVYSVLALWALALAYTVYELITAPLSKEDERPIRNNRPSKHGLHEGQGRQD